MVATIITVPNLQMRKLRHSWVYITSPRSHIISRAGSQIQAVYIQSPCSGLFYILEGAAYSRKGNDYACISQFTFFSDWLFCYNSPFKDFCSPIFFLHVPSSLQELHSRPSMHVAYLTSLSGPCFWFSCSVNTTASLPLCLSKDNQLSSL